MRTAGRPCVVAGVVRAAAVLIAACTVAGCGGGGGGGGDAAIAVPTRPIAADAVATTAPAGTVAAASAPDTTAAAPCRSVRAGLHEIVLTAGGADHPVRILVPGSFDGEPLPVVIDWHGLGADGDAQASLSGYEALAEREGFVSVHPTGVGDETDARSSWQLRTTDDEAPRDDLAFAGALIDELVAGWCADASRVYSTGMSNGGFFTARLICELGDRLAAAVSVAGLWHPDSCPPDISVPYLAFHGTADQFVPFDGSGDSVLVGGDGPPLPAEFFTSVIPDEFAEFAAASGCAAATVDTALAPDMVRHDYTECRDGAELAFVEVVGGGHTWPGADGVPPSALDATVDGWAFMSRFSR